MALRISLYKIKPSYILRPRGKNLKFTYMVRCALRSLTPKFCLRKTYQNLLKDWESRPDAQEIRERADYYCKLTEGNTLPGDAKSVGDIPNGHGVYNRDTFEIVRYFAKDMKLCTAFGDNTKIPATPALCKSRPVAGANENAVLLNMDKVRHFIFLKDKKRFTDKADKAIFRGAAFQAHRRKFMERFFGSALVDCADTRPVNEVEPREWHKDLITLYDHLKFKFVVCLEGNDVASNLKWVMSSNSCAVMPRPTYETWFMEGRLIPNYHYIEIAPDYSDLEEKIRYYSEHTEQAEAIAHHANAWCAQFQNAERELLISLLVMKKYFSHTGQQIRLV